MIEPETKKIGVVFIHGFKGGTETWSNKKGERFCELLSSDDNINREFVFFEFDYFTQVLDVFKSVVVQNLKKLLNKLPGVNFDTKIQKNRPIKYLSHLLNGYLRTELDEFDEVILVAHSMGGLIAKDHILNYVAGEGPRPVGYISMAVPHKGSIGALLLAPSANVNAKEMQPLSEYSDSLNTEWYERKDELPKCLYLIATHDECVPEVSSLPYKVKTADRFTLNHDHTSICKPDDKKDHSFKRVKKFLEEVSYEKSMLSVAAMEYCGAENSFDKEVFVIKLILSEIGEMGIADAKASFFHAEIISKAAKRDDKQHLTDLQKKVLSLYRQTYNSNSKKTADEIFNAVHKELRDQDSKLLMCAVRYINFMHKGGLLHQIANKLDRTVIWDKDVTDEAIKQIIS
jgi:hypothetical protein